MDSFKKDKNDPSDSTDSAKSINFKQKMDNWIEKYILKKIYYLLVFVLIIIIIILKYNYSQDLLLDSKIGRISAALGFIALILTIIITSTQGTQIDQLTQIGKETAKLLRTKSAIEANTKAFFRGNEDGKYKLIFPVDYAQKTLPLINAADSYAIQVIYKYVGVKNLTLMPISRESDEDDVGSGQLSCDSILLCDVNPALKKLFNFNTSQKRCTHENEKNLPCWFESEIYYIKDLVKKENGNKDLDKEEKIIEKERIIITVTGKESHTFQQMSSPCEDYCREAAGLNPGEKFEAPEVVSDYGILARITEGEHHYIIVAGIHGYGTWITASFLDSIIQSTNEKDEYSSVFFGTTDFIAVIDGRFNTQLLFTTKSGVYNELLWTKDAEGWKKFSRQSKEKKMID